MKKLIRPTFKISKCIDDKGSSIAEYSINFNLLEITRNSEIINDKDFLISLKKDFRQINDNYQKVLIYVNGSSENFFYVLEGEKLTSLIQNSLLDNQLIKNLSDDFTKIKENEDFVNLSIYEFE